MCVCTHLAVPFWGISSQPSLALSAWGRLLWVSLPFRVGVDYLRVTLDSCSDPLCFSELLLLVGELFSLLGGLLALWFDFPPLVSQLFSLLGGVARCFSAIRLGWPNPVMLILSWNCRGLARDSAFRLFGGIAFVVRNSLGEPLLAWAGVLKAHSAFRAEIMACTRSLQEIQFRGLQNMVMESDCLELVNALTQDLQCPQWDVIPQFVNCLNLFKELQKDLFVLGPKRM
ncbi:hypothetical protein L484_027276 [Morus notabilis]|uniref:RNase H type-1 domain-containing protein n=1 Tax=Morus notabilis TaxID=981085 RepID=W9R5Z4_9ROSA|nr:hypothetical protein L484_027276 [Morus notabilis]